MVRKSRIAGCDMILGCQVNDVATSVPVNPPAIGVVSKKTSDINIFVALSQKTLCHLS